MSRDLPLNSGGFLVEMILAQASLGIVEDFLLEAQDSHEPR